jgi:hypothetical protein
MYGENGHSLRQKTRCENLVRNHSSGTYFARFRLDGKLFWQGLDTDVLSVAAQRLADAAVGVSCFCALRVPPSRKAMAGGAARPQRN